MKRKNKHINFTHNRTIRSLIKGLFVLLCTIWFIQSGSVQAQVINNQGAAISVTGGTFVQGDTLENTAGTISNDGIIQLNGHYINIGTTQGNGIYNLKGNWINTGTFTPGNSTVRFNGTNFQLVQTSGDPFFHFILNNTGAGTNNRIILSDNVTVSDSLDLISGNIQTDANILYLEEQTPASLDYSSSTGSRIIGKFERGVSELDNYLFPIGSGDHYNPMNLTFNDVAAGSILSEFVANDPDSIGLPLPDPGYVIPTDTVEVYNTDSTGYWSVTAKNLFTSTDFDVNLSGSGFSEVQNASRIIKRTAPANDWILEGIHKDGADSVANRNTLIGVDGAPGHHFGWGHIRPRIQTQPEDTAICDGESATFSIVATGRGTLSFEWEVLERSGGWIPISDDATYANSATDTLLIIAADTSMSGYKYRVIVTDSLGNFHRSNSQATLTVNPRPVATATPQQDTICNGETTFIDINSTVPGTTYSLEVLYFGSITGASTTLVDDTTIQQTLTNLTLYADSVIYRIFPTGPFSTQCGGTADTVIIWVEPTVIISAVSDTICNRDFTNIDIRSENVTTNGIHYTWTATATDLDVSGFTNNAVGQDTLLNITDQLVNVGVDSAIVHYTITPWTLDASGNLKCSGTPINIDIWVEPTVEINALNDTICDVTSTNITVTSPNTTTNGIRFTWTVLDNPNITGETNSAGNGQNIGTAITQTLTNTSFSKQLVQYTITPWSVNASNENECTDAAEVITIDIWVDPTPRVFTSIVRDTICNDTRTNITLTTPNVMTVGVVTFDYNSLADAGLTGNSTGITNLNDSYVITDSLHNSTTFPAISPQVVRYTITPRSLATGCANGPNVIDSITVHPTAYTNFNPIDSVRCFGESNGSANVVARNGVNIFTYLWNDPLNQTDSTAIGLSQGDYIVTVTDNQSCIKIDTVTIDEPDILVPVVDTIRDVSCNGQGDGFIIMLPTGGNSQYRYTWKKGSNPPFVVDGLGVDSVGGLNGATYYVTVTDWKGCTDNTSAEVIEPPQTAVEVISDNVRCYGENNGSATANAPGFTNYVWSTGATTASITNLSPNVYTVTATNPEGCTKTGIANITEPDLIQIDSIVSTIISCEGDADGTIELNVIGGNTIVPYTYNWSTPDGSGLVVTDEDQSGLSGGTYFVTINDWRLCTVDTFAIVSEPGEYDSEIQVTDVTCFEDADGTIDLVVTGGNSEGTYEYNWVTADGNGLTQGIEDQSGLSGGTYYVTITDSKDCEIYNTASIFEPDLLEAIISETNSTCFGNEDGTAVVDIFGGNGGYSISWSPNGETVDSIYGLSSGTYQVNVIDSEGCVASNEVEISEPDEILNDVSFENITCFGYGNGQIIITPQGGITPYTYQWSHSGIFTDSLATNLDPGSYSISVVDKNNCLEVSSVDITQPDPLTLTATKEDITCYGLDDGYITLSMFGGTPDYNYNWSNGFTTNSGDQLTPGTYQINISDLHNCQVDTNIVIEEPDKLIITPVVVRPTCPDIQDGSIDLNITGGRTPYMIYWDDGNNQENLTEIRSGIYEVVVNDSSLCEVDSVFVVRSAFDDCIDIPTAFTPNNDGINDTWVIDMQGLYPDAEVQVFDRWGKIVFYSKGYEESQYWDGTYNGKQLPMDAYYYIIYLKNGAERLSGSITIIR